MQGIAKIIAGFFGFLFTFLTTYFSRKASIGLALIGIYLAITVAFYVAIKALVFGITSLIPNQWLLMYFYALWPSNAETCFTAIFSAEILAFLYRHKITVVNAVASS